METLFWIVWDNISLHQASHLVHRKHHKFSAGIWEGWQLLSPVTSLVPPSGQLASLFFYDFQTEPATSSPCPPHCREHAVNSLKDTMKPLSLGLKGRKGLSQIYSRSWRATPFLLPPIVPALWGHFRLGTVKRLWPLPQDTFLIVEKIQIFLFWSSFVLNKSSFVLFSKHQPHPLTSYLPGHHWQMNMSRSSSETAFCSPSVWTSSPPYPRPPAAGLCHCHCPWQNKGLSHPSGSH